MASPRPGDLLRTVAHRPWPPPQGRWNFVQNWREAVFLHFPVDAAQVQAQLPPELAVDTHDGQAWISIVLFSMVGTRPSWLPAWPPISDFHEVNVRTYVRHGDRDGVFFLRIEAGNWISVQLARLLSVLPYHTAHVQRGHTPGPWFELHSGRDEARAHLTYATGAPIPAPDALDHWLVERYALYERRNGRTWCYDVHHVPWPLQQVHVQALTLTSTLCPLITPGSTPARAHFSPGVQVLSWRRRKP